ncbi:hypothetical protein M406DRAFT_272084 [Cryphonectria parasitica EP155]|uniref:DSC E3 ubiquitin ligase complex subunit A n=1 Tax=Cryphonectria parasitica (strain ATCC 38755 / EP155) TaxID=660469 RepID=A0A9P4YC33_CRYP1|nr:uncharacterized protein M406DRAFT_272084 [Cryphonectria parasitica EP155]KAF3770799.1 hypothetical protein M406DRAFT_272084 [Cryphonectria parasitica EP155]
MPPPQQESARFLGVIIIFIWMMSSGGGGQAGYFATPFLVRERLARQQHSFGVLNSTAWGDFNPRQTADPPNGTEATRYLNITGFRQADYFAWEDLGRFKDRCLQWSRSTSPLLPAGAEIEGVQVEDDGREGRSAWDLGSGSAVWQNATGIVKGSWVRQEASVSRSWADYNFTAMTPSINWIGTHGEWNRNATGIEGDMQLRVEDKRRYVEYDDEVVDIDHGRLSTGGSVREVAATLTIEDAGPLGGGGAYEMRLHGVHWPRQGNMLLTTTSEKFAGIFGLPHLAPDQNFFQSSQKLLNQTIDEVLAKKEKSAFTDQSNPWTSNVGGAEDVFNPSPHCEYVVYLQVHPFRQGGPLPTEGQETSIDGMRDVVKEIEDELRYPTGAPVQHIPELQMSAIIYSPDCAYFLESKGPPDFPESQGFNHLAGFKEEIWIYDVNFYMLVTAAIAFGQVYLLKSQMRESCTPSTMGRVSFWTLLVMALADGMMFALSAALALDSTHFYLRALMLTFALFMSMMIGGSFLGEVYRIQEPEWRPREREHTPNNSTPRPPSTPAPPANESLPRPVTAGGGTNPTDVPVIVPSDQDVDADIVENLTAGAAGVPTAAVPAAGGGGGTQRSDVIPFSTIVGRLIFLGSVIGFLSLAARSWWKPVRNSFINATLFAYLSLWVPQIIRNTQRNSRRAFSWQFMVGQSVLRILPISYFYLHPNNLIFSESDWTAFAVLAGWLWMQLWVLFFQDVLGPRFGMPKGWMPEAWDYHPVLREDNLEAGGLPIGLAPSSSAPSSPSLERTRSMSLSSGEVDRAVREKGSSSSVGAKGGSRTHTRAIDCAICCEVLEVPVVKAGQEADPTGGGVAGLLERRKYMVTPCRHIFHSACLEGWLRYRLQCPICREELPPL